MTPLVCYFDGGCGPNNPGGHAGCGALVKDGRLELFVKSHYIGYGPEMSNNVAEYGGIILVFEFLLAANIKLATVRGDSKMVIRQLQGKMKARKGLYISHFKRARELYRKLGDNGAEIKLEWIPREHNSRADYLAGQAIKNAPRGNKRNAELIKLVKAQRADDRDRNIRFRPH
jgi:ribonuclease HI